MQDKPIHRDDIDNDLLAEIEQKFAALYPGFKVTFAGDSVTDTSAIFAALEKQSHESLAHGTCIDCGAQMPEYKPDQDGWEPADGWGMFEQIGTGESMGWQCPACDEEEQDGVPRRFLLPEAENP